MWQSATFFVYFSFLCLFLMFLENNNFMKKIFLSFVTCFIVLLVGVTFFGCENATDIRASAISEITAAGSDNYGIRITFQEDKRIENKSLDIQVKCDKKIDNVIIWHENEDKQSIAFGKEDEWYSLTSLLCLAANKPNTEKFEPFGEALTKTYMFNSGEKIKLTFRVVVGDAQANAQKSGQVLTGSVQVSNEFELKIN